ncbi:MAG TPA: hypothetical protein VJL29_06565 [Thermoguttaceae bacterium]|nr:hypothetical protein [Thermoguttaceae bacterium]
MADKVLDVYRDWLGVQDKSRPLNHYQLLRLDKFEDNPAVIRARYRKLVSHVRRFATGDFGDRVTKLLNELTTAMLCLTDVQRKRDYDAALGRSDTTGLSRRTFEDILLANKVIDQAQLAKARNYAKAVGLDMRDAVLQQKLAPPEAVMLAYAEAVGLPYVELTDFTVVQALVPMIPANIARQHSCVPVLADDTQVVMASPNPLVPDVEEELRLRLGKTIRSVLCTPAAINDAVARHFPREAMGTTPGTPAAKAKAAPPPADKEKTLAQRVLTEHRILKFRRMTGIIGFNVTVIASIIGLGFFRGFNRLGWWDMIIAAAIGLVGAAVGYVIGPKYYKPQL